MRQALLPLLIEPAELDARLGDEGILLVDLSRPEVYAQRHLPGALSVDYASITAAAGPAMGLVPDAAQLSQVVRAAGLAPERHVVAYDGDGNTRAARFLWTLELIGHTRYSLLNGGSVAWQQEGRRLTSETGAVQTTDYRIAINPDIVADKHWILDHLGDAGVTFLDARTPEEYEGTVVRAQRGGHIPGAVNYNYLSAIDQGNRMRLRPAAELRASLADRGVVPEKEVVVYCQTHHRSAHTWFVLKQLEFGKVRGYPGSWSEWGNDPTLPIERRSST